MRFTSRCERSALMTREATFLVQAFDDFKGGRLKPSPPVAFKSADGARRTAERMFLSHTGVAVSRNEPGQPDVGSPAQAPLRYRGPDGRDRQAGVPAHPSSQLCDAS